MRFIAWLITLAENSDRIAEAAADRLRAKLGGHTDMVVRIIHFLLITAGISSPLLMYFAGAPLPVYILVYTAFFTYLIVYCIFPELKKYPTFRLRILADGTEQILAFFVTGIACLGIAAYTIWAAVCSVIPTLTAVSEGIVLFCAELVIFWNGIIKVYCTSVQLGLKYRVWGIVLGMVMPADLVMLALIYRITRRECAFETEKALLNKSRRDDQLCRTKYPLLLVHGVFFRDSKLMNYWGRIPAELEANGAVIFYGEQQSAALLVMTMESLGIPVMVERSSYESHPLGRTEWMKLYAVLLGKEDVAEKVFKEQTDKLDNVLTADKTDKTVAFFYINSVGAVNVRKSGDYVSEMISLAGGNYVPEDTGESDNALSTMNMQMEEFYAKAKDADYIIYNSTIDGELQTIDELLSKSELLADFKAVKNGNVWCTGKNLFQETTGLGTMIEDIHTMLTTDDDSLDNLTYMHKLK